MAGGLAVCETAKLDAKRRPGHAERLDTTGREVFTVLSKRVLEEGIEHLRPFGHQLHGWRAATYFDTSAYAEDQYEIGIAKLTVMFADDDPTPRNGISIKAVPSLRIFVDGAANSQQIGAGIDGQWGGFILLPIADGG